MNCTRCEGTGFLNISQVPESEIKHDDYHNSVLLWMLSQTEPHDVSVCDCCGNGDEWYGTPGEHYSRYDPVGRNGPYDYNGGLCECN